MKLILGSSNYVCRLFQEQKSKELTISFVFIYLFFRNSHTSLQDLFQTHSEKLNLTTANLPKSSQVFGNLKLMILSRSVRSHLTINGGTKNHHRIWIQQQMYQGMYFINIAENLICNFLHIRETKLHIRWNMTTQVRIFRCFKHLAWILWQDSSGHQHLFHLFRWPVQVNDFPVRKLFVITGYPHYASMYASRSQ